MLQLIAAFLIETLVHAAQLLLLGIDRILLDVMGELLLAVVGPGLSCMSPARKKENVQAS